MGPKVSDLRSPAFNKLSLTTLDQIESARTLGRTVESDGKGHLCVLDAARVFGCLTRIIFPFPHRSSVFSRESSFCLKTSCVVQRKRLKNLSVRTIKLQGGTLVRNL